MDAIHIAYTSYITPYQGLTNMAFLGANADTDIRAQENFDIRYTADVIYNDIIYNVVIKYLAKIFQVGRIS